MALKQVLEAMDLLDGPTSGQQVAACLREVGLEVDVIPVTGNGGTTSFLNLCIEGTSGRRCGGDAPTLGIVGMLGGSGARPTRVGLVSDADGAICALAAAIKIADMRAKGDALPGDVFITTHICSQAPTVPHDPVPFMGFPVDMDTMNKYQVYPEMDAILTVDATKGNRILNRRGIAISPTVKEGWILPVSSDLLGIVEAVTGELAAVLPICDFDITPYDNGLVHLNSILQPCTATTGPVVGVALTSQSVISGCATGANHPTDLSNAVRFCVEVAKAFGMGQCSFHDEEAFQRAVSLYGPATRLQGRA